MRATNLRLLSTALLCILSAGRGIPVEAAPQGGNVVAGEGGIQQPDATTTVVTQASPSLVIDWNSFNIGSAERVQFKQPDAAAAVLNRIGDARPSQIDGALSANGRVFLINPNGLVFGSSAVVNVGSLVAGSLGIANDDFMRGDYRLSAPSGQEGGRVVNHGLLSAALGGSVTLFGGNVTNDGLIVANYGQVNLGVGHKVLLDFDGDGLLRFEVSEPVLGNMQGVTTAVTNSGSIVAPGGQVILTARAAKDVFTQAVNNSGVIQAVGVDRRGGVVRLVGAGGAVANSGTLDASSADSQGGTIDVLGDQVALSDGAQLDASGATGGGTIRVGGDYQGKNPAITNAQLTYVGHQVSLKADAVAQGDGGKIVVWSDHDTNYFGTASARGGALSGNGGTAEVSGKGALTYSGTADLRAPSGANGTLLLDPTDITISSGAIGASTGTLTLGATISESGTAAASTLTDGDLNNQLGLSSVEVTTSSAGAGTGNLVVDATAAINGSGNDLTLTSVGSGTVTLDGTINNVGSLTLNSAGGAVSGTGSAAGSNLLTGVTDFNVSTHQSHGVTYSGFITVNGSGQLDNLGVSYDDGGDTATATGVSYNGFSTINGATGITNASLGFDAGTGVSGNGNTFGAGYTTVAGLGTLAGITNYDVATGSNGAVSFSGFTTVNGSDRLDNLGVSYDDGSDTATATGVSYHGFATINGATGITNASLGFDAGTGVSGNGNTFGAGYITVAGAGTLSGITNYDVATGSDGTVSFSGFSTLDGVGGGTLSSGHVWDITGANSGTVDGLAFGNFANLKGTTSADSFVFGSSGSLSGSLDGGAGADSLHGADLATTWTVSGTGSGAMTGISGGFAHIESLVGGGNTNAFNVNAGGAVDSLIGGSSVNTFNVYAGGTVSSIIGGAAGNTFNLYTGANPVAIIDDQSSLIGDSFNIYSSVGAIDGGAGNDHFVVGAGGAITDMLNGKGGTDTLDYSGVSGPVVINLDNGAAAGVSNVENLLGGSGANTLIGPNESATWSIDQNNGGTIQYSTLVNFSGFQTLSGGSGGNTFNVAGGSVETINAGSNGDRFSINGMVNSLVGGAGNDTVDLLGGVINTLNGGGGDNQFKISGGSVLTLDGGTGNNNSLAVTGGNHTWSVTGGNAGNVNGVVTSFSHIQTLEGGEGGDVFNVDANGVIAKLEGAQTGSGGNTFNIAAGGVVGSVVGGNGDDTLNLDGGVVQVSMGAGNDRVVPGDGGNISSALDGGDGTDTLDYHNFSGNVVADLGQNTVTGVGGIANIEVLVGGLGGNTLLGPNTAADWKVLGADNVTINGYMSALGFHSLQGGSGVDRFDISADFSGSVDGGAGADTVNINAPVNSSHLDLVADEVNFNAPGQINAAGGMVTITAGTVNADQKDVHIIADSLVLHAADHAGTYALPLGLEISTATDFGTGSRNFVSGFFGATQGDFTDVGKTTLNIYRGQSAVVQDRGRIDPALFIKDFNLFTLIDGGVRLTPDQREE
jgi:filamentous hemagglutinin family protein